MYETKIKILNIAYLQIEKSIYRQRHKNLTDFIIYNPKYILIFKSSLNQNYLLRYHT